MADDWAVACFGERADEVGARIVFALDAAHRVGTRTQYASGQRQRYAYGSTWISRFDLLVEYLGDLDGAATVHLPRTAYRLVRLDGRLIVPFVLAHSLEEVPAEPVLTSDTLRAVAARSLPAPEPPMTLFDLDRPRPERSVDGGPAPVFVGVVCRAGDAGLRAVLWGLATSVDDDGVLSWSPQYLPLPRREGDRVPAPRRPLDAAHDPTESGHPSR